MAKDEFQANWRGARIYQFDEEARLKQAALDRRFTDPAHLPQANVPAAADMDDKIIDTAPSSIRWNDLRWNDRRHELEMQPRARRRRLFTITVLLLSVITAAGYAASRFLTGRQPGGQGELSP